MDPSISDILASVTRAHHATNGTSDSNEPNQDLQHLTRAWIAERVAPELLPYPTEMMDRVTRRIRGQIETIEDRTSRMDAGTSFALVVIQTELERFKFLVRSFLRARIAKIDAHPLHTLSRHTNNSSQSATPSPPLLSPQEAHYAQTHATLLHTHYTSSFLSSFPAKLQRFDDKAGAGGVGMVEGPDLDKAVFVRCLGIPPPDAGTRRNGIGNWRPEDDDEDNESRDAGAKEDASFGTVEVSCGYTETGGEDIDMADAAVGGSRRTRAAGAGEKVIGMRRGDIWIVRWSGVRDAVAKGWCELI